MKRLLKSVSIICVSAMLMSLFSIVAVVSAETDPMDAVILAASAYVEENQNLVTLEGLLGAVGAVDSGLTLAAEDFYILHAVDGCYDDDTVSGYPLSIPGHDGAVAAIFRKDGTAISFSYAFAHTEELIHINEVAIVGTSSGFTYDAGGNVIGYSGNADKIVFPNGYTGTMTYMENAAFPNRNNVKVVMLKNHSQSHQLQIGAFNGYEGSETSFSQWKWQSLKALDIFGGENFCWSDKRGIFQNSGGNACVKYLPTLKYMKLPSRLENGDYIGNWNFSFLPSLVNMNVPLGYIMWGAFKYTAVRELTHRSDREADFGSNGTYGINGGTVNDIEATTSPTFIQGVAYAAASLNEKFRTESTVAGAISNAAANATGWYKENGQPDLHSPATDYFRSFTASLTEDWTTVTDKDVMTVSICKDSNSVNYYRVKDSASYAAMIENIRVAMANYVSKTGNVGTREGLLAAVQAVNANITIQNNQDFYIKHAVDGCYDNDASYPLSIPGRDGAVVAVLTLEGARIGFAIPIAHTEELIQTNKTAVVGTSAGFTYDASNNVVGYSGDAEKIVIPAGFSGTMAAMDSAAFPGRDNVKVVMLLNSEQRPVMKENAFNGNPQSDDNLSVDEWQWKSLKALNIYGGFNYLWWADNAKTHIFDQKAVAFLPSLKYLYLPEKLDNSDAILGANFSRLPKLVNANITKTWMDNNVFCDTGLREIEKLYTGPINSTFNSEYITAGTRNIVDAVSGDITFAQAAAYLAASVSNRLNKGDTAAAAISSGVASAKPWNSTASEYFNSFSVTLKEENTATVNGTVTKIGIGDGLDTVVLSSETYNSGYITKANAIKSAVAKYVTTNGNIATYEGLCAAIYAVAPEATLSASDYYIKHAVPGVTDDDTTSGYPLNIKGSDGAVVAVIKLNGTDINIAVPFAHEKEQIHVSSVAVVGSSAGFTYDTNNNVTGYSGNAEKIVVPAGYNGTLTEMTDENFPNRNNVKVVMLKNSDNRVPLQENVFSGYTSFGDWKWASLKALDIYGGADYLWTTNEGKTHVFATSFARYLPVLKYLNLPVRLDNLDYTHAENFSNCPNLENINLPCTATKELVLDNTAVREIICRNAYNGDCLATFTNNDDYALDGTRNIIYYGYSDAGISPLASAALFAAFANERIVAGNEGASLETNAAAAAKNYLNVEITNLGNCIGDYSFTATDKTTDRASYTFAGEENGFEIISFAKGVKAYVLDSGNTVSVKIKTTELASGIHANLNFNAQNFNFVGAVNLADVTGTCNGANGTVSINVNGSAKEWVILNFTRITSAPFSFSFSNLAVGTAGLNTTVFANTHSLLMGDVTNDGVVNIQDLVRLKKYNDNNSISANVENAMGEISGEYQPAPCMVNLKKVLLGNYPFM